jgi:polar amino acid transport system substrate-binding protein
MKNPAKWIRYAVLIAASLTGAISAQARSFDEIQKDGKIVIATEGQFPPFNFFLGTKLSGFEVEVAELVAKKMNVKIEWKALGFDALLAGLRQDRWDIVIASHGITDERAKAVTFAAPHYCSGGQVVSLDASIKTAADLSGKVVAVQTGTTYLESVKKLPGIKEVKNFPKDTDARSALLAHRVDAWVSDRFVAKQAVTLAPDAGLKIGDLVFVERIAAAVAKGNQSLAQAYNKALAEIMADGSYTALSKKYFNEDVRCK